MSFRPKTKVVPTPLPEPIKAQALPDKSIPFTPEEFRRARLRRIVVISVPVLAALLIVGVVTWRATKPSETHNYYADGEKYYHSGRFYEAAAAFDHVVEERPNFMEAYRFRGISRMQLGQTGEARQDLDKAIQMAPADMANYGLRARLLRSTGDFQRSLADYSRMIELHPTAEAYAGRAACYRELGKNPEALTDYDLALAMRPIVDYYMQQGLILQDLRDYHKAVQSFSKAIELRPDEPYAYRARAFAKEQLGDRTAARADREKADAMEKFK